MAAREHEDLVYDPSIADIIDFVFPRNLQHPLSTSRLYCYSLCGPLDKHHKLRCGIRGRKVLYEYELEEMCLQYEREDIIQIYLHNPRNFGTLTAKEQEMIISQADGHLKRAKGKSYLPPINREEVYLMLMALPQRESEIVCFHDVQNAVNKFRENRIKKFKLVYPELGTMKNLDQEKLPSAERRKIRKIKSSTAVSEAVAPSTMFRHMEGLRSADQTDMVRDFWNLYSLCIQRMIHHQSFFLDEQPFE